MRKIRHVPRRRAMPTNVSGDHYSITTPMAIQYFRPL
jgi:hypothetical protein